MNQGTKRSSDAMQRLARVMSAAALALSVPTLAMTMAAEPPNPSDSQRELIEAHDTAGIGWWSSASLEIDPAP